MACRARPPSPDEIRIYKAGLVSACDDLYVASLSVFNRDARVVEEGNPKVFHLALRIAGEGLLGGWQNSRGNRDFRLLRADMAIPRDPLGFLLMGPGPGNTNEFSCDHPPVCINIHNLNYSVAKKILSIA